MNQTEQRKAAKEFIKRWTDRGSEKQDSQSFWLDLLQNVYGIDTPTEYITFEDSVSNMMDSTSFIDGYIEKTNVLIEQKSRNRDLNKGIRQSDGTYLTPFQQALRYSATLPYSRRPRWIVTSNFKEFYIYDMEKPNSDPSIVKLNALEKEYYRLEILIDKTNTQIEKETKVSIKAGELIGQIYDELIEQYHDPEDPYSLKSINQLSVRLVFSFYAEDAGLFGKRRMFHDYLVDFDTRNFRHAIIEFFHVLNTKVEDRDLYLDEKLAAFPYVNGGLFEDMDIEIPQFTDHLRELILENASSDFNWSEISPTIFGSVFESTLNPDQRREGGMHYTSIQNIHKVIDPLFLEALKEELNEIKQLKQHAAIKRRALEFQNKLASLTFLDPAAGSGNFLTETYIALRELENEALVLIHGDNVLLDTEADLIKVSLDQFYGIEVNDFAVSVAKTALWIAESQMFEKTKDLIYSEADFLPIKSYPNIVEGNALTMNWVNVVDPRDLDFIIGNPPFIGARIMSPTQKEEIEEVFKDQKGVGNLDYVAGWYRKAAELINNTDIKCAFVSTSSIAQGQQVSILWESLINDFKININFAHQSFIWNSEASDQASVHCVIIGFSQLNNQKKILYSSKNQGEEVENINPYLINAPTTFIKTRRKPLVDVARMSYGSFALDDGAYTISEEKYNDILKKEPHLKRVLKPFIGGREFINSINRYCIWLNYVREDMELIETSPILKGKIEYVKEWRSKSKRKQTYEAAETPIKFAEIRQPDQNYLAVPVVSSENRRYIPIGYLSREVIASNQLLIVPESSISHFAIMSSNIHMAWMRVVAGRLESRYRYSTTIVYNNFPWIDLNEEQKNKLNKTGKAILKARELYSDWTLKQLYNELTMPPELRKAHQNNDRAVMEVYGMKVGATTESDSVAQLFKMYEKLVSSK